MRNALLLFILPMLLLLGSCSDGELKDEGRTVFHYNESKGITSLDPAQARTMGNIWATAQMFNGLVQLDSSLKVQPCIARSWELSVDGTVFAFHLRTDVRFHDHPLFAGGKGALVTAHDFVYSFNRILDEKTLSPGRWVFSQVDRQREGGFKAVNDTLLHIYLKQAFTPFLSMLSMPYCAVVPKTMADAMGRDFGRTPVGTGPFMFKEWHEGVKLVLHRNPHYFETDARGAALPYLDAVGITFIADAQSVFLEFLKGNLDMLSGLEDGSFKDALLTPNGKLQPEMESKVVMQTMPFLNTEYLGFLMDTTLSIMKDNPLNNKAVRQAINHGFDRQRMIRYLRNGIGTAGTGGIVPPGLPIAHDKAKVGYEYDPEKAKALLTEAGYPNGKGLPEIVLHATSQYLDLCEFIQHQLSEVGIRLRIEVNPGATHGALVSNGQVAFFRKSWIADYADAENYLSLFRSASRTPKGPNYTMYNSMSFDQLYEKAISETNDSARYVLYARMDCLMMEESPVVVLYYDQLLRFTSPNISGLHVNAMNLLDLRRVKKGRSMNE